MALLFFDGFQDPAQSSKPEWSISSGNLFVNQPGRDGTANAGAGSPGNPRGLTFTLGDTNLFHGFAFQPNATLFGSTANLIGWSNGTGPTFLLFMGITATGFLEFRRGTSFAAGVSLGVTSGHDPLVALAWRHLQIKYVAHVSAGTLIVRLDNVTVLSVTGVQTAASTLTPDRFYLNPSSGFGSSTLLLDDMWLCDGVNATATQGRANNDFLGDLKVTTLIPSADGDLSQWTPSTGTAHAALVDEVPPNTTDYNFTSVTGNRDLYQLPDLPTTAGAVYGVRVNLYGLKSDAGASSVKPLVKESGGTITAQTAKALSTTAATYSGEFLFTKPSAPTTAWTAADVNGLQAGAELA